MWSTPSKPAWHLCNLVANTRKMFPTSGDVLLLNLYIHNTTARLSHQIDGLWCFNSFLLTVCSSTSQWTTMPSDSSSQIVIFPLGFYQCRAPLLLPLTIFGTRQMVVIFLFRWTKHLLLPILTHLLNLYMLPLCSLLIPIHVKVCISLDILVLSNFGCMLLYFVFF